MLAELLAIIESEGKRMALRDKYRKFSYSLPVRLFAHLFYCLLFLFLVHPWTHASDMFGQSLDRSISCGGLASALAEFVTLR